MLKLIIAFVCVSVAGYLILLLRSFEYLTGGELKRQARSGNARAKAVYAVRGPYGSQVFILLWTLIGALTSLAIVLLNSVLRPWAVVLIGVGVTLLIHVILPWTKAMAPSLNLAASSSGMIARVLAVIAPLVRVTSRLPTGWVTHLDTRSVNSKDELLEMLEAAKLKDESFSEDEIEIALHALTFGDKKITEIMTPRSVIRSIRAEDILSPVLLGELHDSGFSRFPVTESEKGKFVGILYSKDLSDLHGNKVVAEVMRKELYYVNEFTRLDNVLNAFLRTQHHLFVVVNEFEEVTGIITIEDVLEQIIGRKIVDEFDRYEDSRAVAMQRAKIEADSREESTV